MIGSALTQFVLLWWITDTTGSVSALALAGMFALLPQALLGPIGGTFADRYNRRVIMITADAISAMCMMVLIALFVTNSIELWHIYTMMFIRSSMQAFQQPAAAASTAMLVPESFISRAAGLNQTLSGVMLVAAAPLGALAISVMPIGYALMIDIVTAAFGIVPLVIYRIPQVRVAVADRLGVWKELREGVSTVWHNGGLRRLYLLMFISMIAIMPTFTLTPLLVKEYFGGDAPQVALMEGLSGAGMIAAGIIVAAIAPKRKILWVLWGFAISCFSVAFTALVPGNWIGLAAVFWCLSSVFYILGNGPLIAILQTTVPNQLQGRVLSLLNTMTGLGAPIGLALATPLGEMIGIQMLFIVMGAAGGLITLFGFVSRPLLQIERSMAKP